MERDITAILVFCDSDLRLFKWARKGFQHCRIFIPMANVLVSINPRLSHIDVDLYRNDVSIREICGECTILLINCNIDTKGIAFAPGLGSCVQTCQRILGIGGFIFTPYQLYKRVKKHGMVKESQEV